MYVYKCSQNPVLRSLSWFYTLITFMSVYEMDPRVKLRDIFKTTKDIDLRLMALGEKITENFSFSHLLCWCA